jgi:hypothetical protein
MVQGSTSSTSLTSLSAGRHCCRAPFSYLSSAKPSPSSGPARVESYNINQPAGDMNLCPCVDFSNRSPSPAKNSAPRAPPAGLGRAALPQLKLGKATSAAPAACLPNRNVAATAGLGLLREAILLGPAGSASQKGRVLDNKESRVSVDVARSTF